MNDLLVLIFVPLAAGFVLLFVPGKIKILHKIVAVLISLGAFGLSVQIFRGQPLSYSVSVFSHDALDLTFLVQTTALNKFILLFAMGFGFLICLYAWSSPPSDENASFFYGSLLMAIGGSAGILLSSHLLFLLIFWEIVTVSLYLLVITGGPRCKFAATKSFAMLGLSDGALLLGIAMAWVLSGTFVIGEISIVTNTSLSLIAFLLLMLAAVTKAGAMPLHTWLPTSGQDAPASVMAILPAALDKLLGIYLLVILVRELFVLQTALISYILALLGTATIIIAAMIALHQQDLKKLITYSAISQVGYMILGIATLTPVGIAGGVFHMLNNAIYKCCLFLGAGAVLQAAGTTKLDELGGLGRKMPWTSGCCFIALLSISGVPPLNGFASKWMIYQGIVQMGFSDNSGTAVLWPLWLVGTIFGGALTLGYSVKVLHSVFLSRRPSELNEVRDVPLLMIIPMVVLACLCVLFGVFYQVSLDLFIYPALGIQPGLAIWGLWDSQLATSLLIAAVLLGLLILWIGLKARKVRTVPTWACGEVQPNEQMIVPGTHFYKTVSSMRLLNPLYRFQEKEYFDLYNHGGKIGLLFSGFLKWLHSGLLPMYLTWVILGLLIILMAVCSIW